MFQYCPNITSRIVSGCIDVDFKRLTWDFTTPTSGFEKVQMRLPYISGPLIRFDFDDCNRKTTPPLTPAKWNPLVFVTLRVLDIFDSKSLERSQS